MEDIELIQEVLIKYEHKKIKLKCNTCKIGFMICKDYTNHIFNWNNPKRKHKCDHCGAVIKIRNVYPYTQTKEVVIK